jgi:hypothetical protein
VETWQLLHARISAMPVDPQIFDLGAASKCYGKREGEDGGR